MNLFHLYWLFCEIGVLTYGGGYAMIPLFYDELVRHYQLISATDFGNLLAIAQMTPGPVGINAATYIGYTQGGIAGSAIATLGVVTPSVIIITIIVHCLKRFEDSLVVKGILQGIRPVTLGLIGAAVCFFAEMSVFTGMIPFEWLWQVLRGAAVSRPDFGISWQGVLIFAASWLAIDRFKLNMFLVLILAAVAGMLLF